MCHDLSIDQRNRCGTRAEHRIALDAQLADTRIPFLNCLGNRLNEGIPQNDAIELTAVDGSTGLQAIVIQRKRVHLNTRKRRTCVVALVLDEGELRRRLGRKALFGIQQKGRINHDVLCRGRLGLKRAGRQLKHGRVVTLLHIIQNGTTFAVHPVRVVVLIILLSAITALGHPNHTCNQIVKGKLSIRWTLLTFLDNPLHLLD